MSLKSLFILKLEGFVLRARSVGFELGNLYHPEECLQFDVHIIDAFARNCRSPDRVVGESTDLGAEIPDLAEDIFIIIILVGIGDEVIDV